MSKLKRLIRLWCGRPGPRRALEACRKLAPVAALGSCSLAAMVVHAAQGAAHHGEPHVNWWRWSAEAPPVGWFIVDFIIFIAALVYFARKPVRAAFRSRHRRIKTALAEAAAALGAAKARYEEFRKRLADVEEESAAQVEQGRQVGGRERSEIVQAAAQYAERLRADAEAVRGQELEAARSRLTREQAAEVLRCAEQQLRDQLADDDRVRLVEEAILQLENEAPAAAPRPRVTPKVQASAAGGLS